MKKTDATIGLDDLFVAGMETRDESTVRKAMARVAEIEPYLAGYLDREIVQIAGKLVLAGATPMVCREMTTDVLSVVLTVFTAQRRASNRLWRDTFPDSPLANLMIPSDKSEDEKPSK